jgi:transposase
MPPTLVKPYVKRQKNDMADAEAICEAVTRPDNAVEDTRAASHSTDLEKLLIRQDVAGIGRNLRRTTA